MPESSRAKDGAWIVIPRDEGSNHHLLPAGKVASRAIRFRFDPSSVGMTIQGCCPSKGLFWETDLDQIDDAGSVNVHPAHLVAFGYPIAAQVLEVRQDRACLALR